MLPKQYMSSTLYFSKLVEVTKNLIYQVPCPEFYDTFSFSVWGLFSIRDLLNSIAAGKVEMILEWLIDLKRNFRYLKTFLTVSM